MTTNDNVRVIFLFLLFLPLLTFADEYAVFFTDKEGTVYDVTNPEQFLSPNAIQRREAMNIPIDNDDLPLSKTYIEHIQEYDLTVSHQSKWLNLAVIHCEDEAIIEALETLHFVQKIIKIYDDNWSSSYKKNKLELAYYDTDVDVIVPNKNHGVGFGQIQMIEGDLLHDLGFHGQGVDIAVMDNGFYGVNHIDYFDKLYQENRIVEVYNYVQTINESVYSEGSHGTSVLSTMAANKDGAFIGTAPGANYYLFVTEDNQREGLAEEINWAMAAEKADSLLGVHAIITTSLGYSTGYNNPADEHSYADMDGNTTIITRAADIAASKGMLIINSAGNEGNSDWQYITAPADGDSVLAVGAVFANEVLAGFSSRGPSSDGDIKPNVCAQGAGVFALSANGDILPLNGTSFSCPITSGMAACLWEAFPNKSNMDIFNAIQQSADRYEYPDYDYGYGIPNFRKAFLYLLDDENAFVLPSNDYTIFPNPFHDVLLVKSAQLANSYEIQLYTMAGEKLYQQKIDGDRNLESELVLRDLNTLQSGTYIVRIKDEKGWHCKKIVKL